MTPKQERSRKVQVDFELCSYGVSSRVCIARLTQVLDLRTSSKLKLAECKTMTLSEISKIIEVLDIFVL